MGPTRDGTPSEQPPPSSEGAADDASAIHGGHEVTQMPVAKVEMLPITGLGTILWLLGFLYTLRFHPGELAQDIALAGMALGIAANIWAAQRYRRNRALPPA